MRAFVGLLCFAFVLGEAFGQAPDDGRPVSLKLLLPNLADDQKRIWLFPLRVAHGQDWLPAASILATTATLVATDPLDAPYFRRTTDFNGFNRVFNSSATTYATIAAPISLYVAGMIRKDSKMQRVALLAGEAVVNAEILTTVMKGIDGRLRPSATPLEAGYNDTWFEHYKNVVNSDASFPSGHSIVAFSIATVISRRYRNHRWVPYVAYGGAALVGFSRVTQSAHFVSDVFMGAALGYSISRFAVLRQ